MALPTAAIKLIFMQGHWKSGSSHNMISELLAIESEKKICDFKQENMTIRVQNLETASNGCFDMKGENAEKRTLQ